MPESTILHGNDCFGMFWEPNNAWVLGLDLPSPGVKRPGVRKSCGEWAVAQGSYASWGNGKMEVS